MNTNNQRVKTGFRPGLLAYLLLFLSSLFSLAVLAGSSQTLVYPATFFAQYAPRNALEMVQQLPGFTFDEGSSSRGFGGNAGNVLIDGVRPTSKWGGIAAALIRIPANQVEWIELLPGNVGEALGHALIANVISIKSKTSGSWAIRARQTEHTKTKPNVEAVLRMPLGQWDTAFDLVYCLFIARPALNNTAAKISYYHKPMKLMPTVIAPTTLTAKVPASLLVANSP